VFGRNVHAATSVLQRNNRLSFNPLGTCWALNPYVCFRPQADIIKLAGAMYNLATGAVEFFG
ncbi:MAG TPA: hypothetical protein VMJ14_16760, partial [Burkholderiales bacterium]|nr:hypothetical protein [Burkholderiales bacterium]